MPTQNALEIDDILYALTRSQISQVFSGICPLCNSNLLNPGIHVRQMLTSSCISCRSIFLLDKDTNWARRLPFDNPDTSPTLDKSVSLNSLFHGRCPDCGSEKFIPGPRAGLSVNIQCFQCGSKFNISYIMFFAERI